MRNESGVAFAEKSDSFLVSFPSVIYASEIQDETDMESFQNNHNLCNHLTPTKPHFTAIVSYRIPEINLQDEESGGIKLKLRNGVRFEFITQGFRVRDEFRTELTGVDKATSGFSSECGEGPTSSTVFHLPREEPAIKEKQPLAFVRRVFSCTS